MSRLKKIYMKLLQNRNKKLSMYNNKVKNLIKNTDFKLHNIHQQIGILRTPSNIQDRDFSKNS